jgi:hypothetical protein
VQAGAQVGLAAPEQLVEHVVVALAWLLPDDARLLQQEVADAPARDGEAARGGVGRGAAEVEERELAEAAVGANSVGFEG